MPTKLKISVGLENNRERLSTVSIKPDAKLFLIPRGQADPSSAK
jgi:hypothetical protein